MGKVWNLGHNIKLSDDPESWDSEFHLVNKMQGRLGKLTADQRLMRAQMAEFFRKSIAWPVYLSKFILGYVINYLLWH